MSTAKKDSIAFAVFVLMCGLALFSWLSAKPLVPLPFELACHQRGLEVPVLTIKNADLALKSAFETDCRDGAVVFFTHSKCQSLAACEQHGGIARTWWKP